MTGITDADYCAEQVRRHDPDRYLTSLFAPADRREALFALNAFNLEIARIREGVSEPMMGQIRLQWWRDAVMEIYDGDPRRHQVVTPLAHAVHRHNLTRGLFEAIIDAREQDLHDDPPDTLADLAAYAAATAGDLCELALEALGERGESARRAGRLVGTAWALTGLIRAMPFHLRRGRHYLPVEMERRYRIDRRSLQELRFSEGLGRAVGEIVAQAGMCLHDARALRREVGRLALPALLLAPLTDSYLRQLTRRHDPFDPRLAFRPPGRILRITAAMIRGRY